MLRCMDVCLTERGCEESRYSPHVRGVGLGPLVFLSRLRWSPSAGLGIRRIRPHRWRSPAVARRRVAWSSRRACRRRFQRRPPLNGYACSPYLSHQLFADHPALRDAETCVLVEEPLLMTQYRFHRQKLILHRTSMQHFAGQLRGRGGECITSSVRSRLDRGYRRRTEATRRYPRPVRRSQ